METLRELKPEIGFKFEANGTQYVIEDKLSISRAIEANKIELELFDTSSTAIRNQLVMAYNDLNGNNADKTVKFADAAIKIHNLVNNLNKHLSVKEMPILRYCALHINAKDEDRRTISKDIIDKKIEDWQEAGMAISGFFLLVLNVLPHVKKDFIERMEAISNKVGKNPKSDQKTDTSTTKS